MAKWELKRRREDDGTWGTAMIDGVRVRILLWDNPKRTAMVWHEENGTWIREATPIECKQVGSARSIPLKSRAPAATWATINLGDVNDPRDARVDWSSITGGPRKAWRNNNPSNTKRSAAIKMSAPKGQLANKQSAGG